MAVKSLEQLIIEKVVMIRGYDGKRIYRVYSVKKATDRWAWFLDFDYVSEVQLKKWKKKRTCLCEQEGVITLGEVVQVIDTWKILNKKPKILNDGFSSWRSPWGTGRGKRKHSEICGQE